MTDEPRKPNPVDVHVGSRIRMRRRVMGLSQEELANQLQLTFQQVQKNERGANRVSASKLFGIAAALQAPVSYFFEGLRDATDGVGADIRGAEAEVAIRGFLNATEGLELARRFPLIPKGRLRKQVLELVRARSDDLSETAEGERQPAK